MNAVIEMDDKKVEVTPAMQDQIGETLGQGVLLVHVGTHRWRGIGRVKEATVTVADHEIDEDAYVASWSVCPKEWTSKINNVFSLVTKAVNDAKVKTEGLPTRLPNGIYIIARKSKAILQARLKDIQNNMLKPLAHALWKEMPAKAEYYKQRAQSPEAWKQIAHNFSISEADFVAKFSVELLDLPIDYIHGAEFGARVAGTIVQGLQNELKEAVENLNGRIQEKGIIKGGNLSAVRSAFEKLKSFSFAVTPALLDKMEATEKILAHNTPQTLNSDIKSESAAISGQLANCLSEVCEQAEHDLTVDTVFRPVHRRQVRI